jgi:hypothetical protein
MRRIEMVGLMDRQRLAGGKAGTDCGRATARLGPLRAEIEAGFAQIAIQLRIADEIHRHALAVGQQQHIALIGDLTIEPLQPGPRDGHQFLGLLAMLLQSLPERSRLRKDDPDRGDNRPDSAARTG